MAPRIDIQIPDSSGNIFCAKHLQRQRWDQAKMNECWNCPFYAGSAQGEGVECMYDPEILKGVTGDVANLKHPHQAKVDQANAYKRFISARDRADDLRAEGGFPDDSE